MKYCNWCRITLRCPKLLKGTQKYPQCLEQGFVRLQKFKNPGFFQGLFYHFFQGFSRVLGSPEWQTTFTTNCNHYKTTMCTKCSDSILSSGFLTQNEVLKWLRKSTISIVTSCNEINKIRWPTKLFGRILCYPKELAGFWWMETRKMQKAWRQKLVRSYLKFAEINNQHDNNCEANMDKFWWNRQALLWN